MKKFKTQKTEDYFKTWINAFPESWHPLDHLRFYDFLTSLFLDEDFLSESDLKDLIYKYKNWENEKFIDEFVEQVGSKISELKGFFEYLSNKKMIIAT